MRKAERAAAWHGHRDDELGNGARSGVSDWSWCRFGPHHVFIYYHSSHLRFRYYLDLLAQSLVSRVFIPILREIRRVLGGCVVK